MAAGCFRWVYERLWGLKAGRHMEAELVSAGRIEVDGRPPDGRPQYDYQELEGRCTGDLSRGRRWVHVGGRINLTALVFWSVG
jgi:hypothetical protein